VSFCVLFVCICVLYYWQRVATQLKFKKKKNIYIYHRLEVVSIARSICRRRPEEVIIVSFRAVTGTLMEVMFIINSKCRLRPEEIVYGTQHEARLLIGNNYCRRRLAKVIHGTLFVTLLLINLWAFLL